MSPAEGIHAILSAASIIEGASGWAGKIGNLTEADLTVSILDRPGKQPEAVNGTDYPGIQVMVRGGRAADAYSTAYAKAREIYNALHVIPQNPAPYAELTSCLARTDIAPLGNDKNDRPMFSLNFDLIVTPANPGYRL